VCLEIASTFPLNTSSCLGVNIMGEIAGVIRGIYDPTRFRARHAAWLPGSVPLSARRLAAPFNAASGFKP